MTPFFRLHSGGVVRNGFAVLLVGPSGAGKSTLVVRLVLDGFSLLSDDEVWIDPASGLVHPTPRSLLLKESAWELFPQHRDKFMECGEEGVRSWWLNADDLRPGCRAAPSPIWALIVVTPPSGDGPSLERIGQTEALTRVLAESMNFPDMRDAGLSVLLNVVRSARLFRLTNGDLDHCARLVSAVLP